MTKTIKNKLLHNDRFFLAVVIGCATILPAIGAAASGNTWLAAAIAIGIPVSIATLPARSGVAK